MALPLLLSAVSLIPHAGSPLPTTGVVVRRPLLLAASQAGRPVAPEDSLLAARPPPSAPQLPAKRPNVLLAVLLAGCFVRSSELAEHLHVAAEDNVDGVRETM